MNTCTENIEKRFNRLIVFFYCLLIISLPVSIALVESMAGIVILIFFSKKFLLAKHAALGKSPGETFRIALSAFYPPGHFLNKWIGLYILAMFVSVVLSQYPMTSLISFVGKLLEGYFLYYCFIDCFKSTEVRQKFILWCVVTAVVMAFDGVFQYFFKWDFFRHLPLVDGRASATLRHANDFGAYLVTFASMIFGLMIFACQKGSILFEELRHHWLARKDVLRVLLVMGCLLMIASLGLTFSRGVWIGYWVSMLIFVLLSRKYLITALLINLVFLGIFLPLLMKYRDVSFTTDSVNLKREYGSISPTVENLSSLSELERQRVETAHSFQLGMGRFGFWEEAMDLIRKYPLFGSGLNTYSKLSTVYAHNCYLQTAGETGLIGLFLFLAMIGVLVARAIQFCRKMPFSLDKMILAGAVAGFFGFMVQSFFDTTFYSVQLGNLMWVMMGLIASFFSHDHGLNKLTKTERSL